MALTMLFILPFSVTKQKYFLKTIAFIACKDYNKRVVRNKERKGR